MQTLDTVSTIDEIVGEVNSSVSNMTECLTTIMEFLEQTVLGDYEHFAQVGEQYHADADTFQQIMQQTKEAVDALEQHIGEISSTVSEINSWWNSLQTESAVLPRNLAVRRTL